MHYLDFFVFFLLVLSWAVKLTSRHHSVCAIHSFTCLPLIKAYTVSIKAVAILITLSFLMWTGLPQGNLSWRSGFLYVAHKEKMLRPGTGTLLNSKNWDLCTPFVSARQGDHRSATMWPWGPMFGWWETVWMPSSRMGQSFFSLNLVLILTLGDYQVSCSAL